MKALTVITPFADYARGDRIIDPEEIDQVLLGHNSHHVVQVTMVDRAPVEAAAPEVELPAQPAAAPTK